MHMLYIIALEAGLEKYRKCIKYIGINSIYLKSVDREILNNY